MTERQSPTPRPPKAELEKDAENAGRAGGLSATAMGGQVVVAWTQGIYRTRQRRIRGVLSLYAR